MNSVRNVRVMMICHGTWPSYGWDNYKHKWNQILGLPLLESGVEKASYLSVPTCDDKGIEICMSAVRYFCPNIIVMLRHGDHEKNMLALYEAMWKMFSTESIILGFSPDCTSKGDVSAAESLVLFVHKMITIDRLSAPDGVLNPDKYVNVAGAYSSSLFYNKNLNRDIDIVFWGETIDRHERTPILQELHRAGINILLPEHMGYHISGDHAVRPSIDIYIDILNRAKLSFNIPAHPTKPILNGRVWESLACGACLVNFEFDTVTSCNILEKNIEYVPVYRNDMVERIRELLLIPDVYTKIAKNGTRRYNESFGPVNFWKTVWKQIL